MEVQVGGFFSICLTFENYIMCVFTHLSWAFSFSHTKNLPIFSFDLCIVVYYLLLIQIVELGKIDAEQSKKQGEEKDARKQTAEDSTNGGEKKASGDSEPSKPKEVRAEVSKKLSADVAPVDKELLQVHCWSQILVLI